MTLTGMLVNSSVFYHSDQIADVKGIFKEWLKAVGLPNSLSLDKEGNGFNATESICNLLITLVDEP